MSASLPIGIDFGTTKTLVCRWHERSKHPVPIRLGRSKDLIPTTVHLDSHGTYLFGDDAEDNRATDGAGYVSRFKRDLQTDVSKHIHGRTVTPVDLTAQFLAHVRERVEEEALHGPVGHAVITVPALYGPAAKANLKKAIQQAGFTDFELLDEPVAAGFAFLHDNPDFAKGQTFLVFDWGGGTLDIAGVRQNGKELSSISQLIGGDAMLGGEDIDDDISNGISALLKQQGRKGIDEQPDEIRFSAWKSIIDGKVLLSRKLSHRFRFQLSDCPVDFEWKRDTFEQFISQTVEKAVSMTKRLVDKAHEQSIPLAGILLIGGSSDIPLVYRRLVEVTGMKVLKYDKRLEAVGMGATILSHARGFPRESKPPGIPIAIVSQRNEESSIDLVGSYTGECINTTVQQKGYLALIIKRVNIDEITGELQLFGPLGGGSEFVGHLFEKTLSFTTSSPDKSITVKWTGSVGDANEIKGTYTTQYLNPSGALNGEQGIWECKKDAPKVTNTHSICEMVLHPAAYGRFVYTVNLLQPPATEQEWLEFMDAHTLNCPVDLIIRNTTTQFLRAPRLTIRKKGHKEPLFRQLSDIPPDETLVLNILALDCVIVPGDEIAVEFANAKGNEIALVARAIDFSSTWVAEHANFGPIPVFVTWRPGFWKGAVLVLQNVSDIIIHELSVISQSKATAKHSDPLAPGEKVEIGQLEFTDGKNLEVGNSFEIHAPAFLPILGLIGED